MDNSLGYPLTHAAQVWASDGHDYDGNRDANTVVRADDLIGREAQVTLPLSAEQRGFVELSVRGSLLRRAARSASRPLERGERVVILRADGHTLIVDPLEMADSREPG